MSKLGILDIVALAKAGYKASDIKELMSVEVADPTPEDGGMETPADKEAQPATENSAKETEKDKQGAPEKEDDVDYKSLYEEKCKELEKAQAVNTHQNQTNLKTENQTLTIDDIVRSFM